MVWICFILSFALVLVTEKLITHNYMELRKIDTNWAIICSSLRQQTSFPFPPVLPFRLMICCWLLACFVLTSGYSGCLYALMAFPSNIETIDTITKLAIAQTNGEIQVTLTASSIYFQLLKVWLDFLRKKTYRYFHLIYN